LFFIFAVVLKCSGRFHHKLWTKSFFAFKQSAYNKQWLGVEHLTWLVILVLTTTSTIKGLLVWDNKFILAYGLSKIKGDSKTAKTDDRLRLNSL
jgi:hypothetical protein